NLRASRKSGNLKAFVMWCSSMMFQPSTCASRAASSSPLSRGTPPRQGTHVLAASSDIVEAILPLVPRDKFGFGRSCLSEAMIESLRRSRFRNRSTPSTYKGSPRGTPRETGLKVLQGYKPLQRLRRAQEPGQPSRLLLTPKKTIGVFVPGSKPQLCVIDVDVGLSQAGMLLARSRRIGAEV